MSCIVPAPLREAVLAPDWAGETVFIIGGGPSVAQQDLSLLRGRRIIAVNSSYERLLDLGGAPPYLPHIDVLVFADKRWWNVHQHRIMARLDCAIVTVCRAIDHKRIISMDKHPPPGLSPRRGALTMRRTTLAAAINLAAIKAPGGSIVILGADGKFTEGRRNHHAPHPFRHVDGCWDWHRDELATLKAPLAARGISVINASPGSAWQDLWPVMSLAQAIEKTQPPPKPELTVVGMLGVGDVIHQRAVLRELMRTHSVTIEARGLAVLHDLARAGLKVIARGSPRMREEAPQLPVTRSRRDVIRSGSRAMLPSGAPRITYSPEAIHKHGSILAAQFAAVGLTMPARPDFSLPVPQAWHDKADGMLLGAGLAPWLGKPLMIYRPIIQNTKWACPSRSPDPLAYDALYRSIRDRFQVVSIADLKDGEEWIVGPAPDVDITFHHGELDFETLAALFDRAALVFANPGFAPVLAQAVGTPVIIVYGGNESFRTTNSVGAHLAPTLAIEPDRPCECHARTHDCDKTITLAPALERVALMAEFAAGEHEVRPAQAAAAVSVEAAPEPAPRTLIFAATYIDTAERLALLDRWLMLNRALNPDADLLLVDSASPFRELVDPRHGDVAVHRFADNIGHLARGGADGWGRAFCFGLQYAIDRGYDYVVHIEGDSLFRLPVAPIVAGMRRANYAVQTVPVCGTKHVEWNWAETGLMMFEVAWLKDSGFIAKYDWPNRTPKPTPESVIFDIVANDKRGLTMAAWHARRFDRTDDATSVSDCDWITHNLTAAMIDQFVDAALRAAEPPPPLVKLNFGCGTNRLAGWDNHDADLDITKRLPFPDAHADLVYAEHVVEHVSYDEALAFLRECRRVLKPGGVIRIAVPSIERVWHLGTADYFKFAAKWAPSEDARGAMHAILYAHGHQAPWTQSLLEASLFYVGFENITAALPHRGVHHPALSGVEGHHRVIGEEFNAIETAVAEGCR